MEQGKHNPNSVEAIVTKQNDKVATQLNPHVSNGKELVMRGMADDIDEFMIESPPYSEVQFIARSALYVRWL